MGNSMNRQMAKSPTCVYNALELMNGLPFKRGVSGMEVDGSNNNNLGDEWISVRVWLQMIQTFVTFVPSWSNTNEVVRNHLGDLLISIENEFQTSADEIADSVKKGDAEVLEAVRSKLMNKVEILKPRIREAYEFFSKNALRNSSIQLPVTDPEVWGQFCSSLTVASRFLSTPMLLEIEGIVSSLQAFLQVYLTRVSDCKLFRNLGLYFECVAIRVARLLFLWWADETDEHHMMVMLKDELQGMSKHMQRVVKRKLPVPSTIQGAVIIPKAETVENSEDKNGMRMQLLADVAITHKRRNLKRVKMSSLDSPPLSFRSSRNDTEKKQLVEENDALKKKIQELEESLRREKTASETKAKELEIVRLEKYSLETEMERFRGISL